MQTLQRSRDVMAGFARANSISLALFAILACSMLLGLVSAEAGMLGGLALGLGQYSNILTTQSAVGTAFATYTTAKSVINPTNLLQLPPNYLYVGKKIRVTVRGGLSSVVTTPGSVTFQIMMGAIVAWTSGAINLTTTGNTLLPFTLQVDLRCDSIGVTTAAKFLGMGTLGGIGVVLGTINGTANSAVSAAALQVPLTAPAVGTGFDSTIANLLDFWAGFSISNAANAIQLYDYTVEELN
jgi:hypothetical protein